MEQPEGRAEKAQSDRPARSAFPLGWTRRRACPCCPVPTHPQPCRRHVPQAPEPATPAHLHPANPASLEGNTNGSDSSLAGPPPPSRDLPLSPGPGDQAIFSGVLVSRRLRAASASPLAPVPPPCLMSSDRS